MRSTQAGLIDILSSYMADKKEHILNSWGQSGSYKNVQSNLCEKPIKNIEKSLDIMLLIMYTNEAVAEKRSGTLKTS